MWEPNDPDASSLVFSWTPNHASSPWRGNSYLSSADNFFGNKLNDGTTRARYDGARNLTREGANENNAEIAILGYKYPNTEAINLPNVAPVMSKTPANEQPHGYNWEIKYCDKPRFFIPIDAMYGVLDGPFFCYINAIVYYRWDGTESSYKKSSDKTDISEISFANEFYEMIDNLLLAIPGQIKIELQELLNSFEINLKQNPQSILNESKAYKDLLEFCNANKRSSLVFLINEYEKNKNELAFMIIWKLTKETHSNVMHNINTKNCKKYSEPMVISKANTIDYLTEITKLVYSGKENTLLVENSLDKAISSLSVYPTPFTNGITLQVELNAKSKVTINIYNVFGQKITNLVDNQIMSAGITKIEWNAKDHKGLSVKSGAYFCNLITEHETITKIIYKQ